MYIISTLNNFQVINPTRSCVLLLQSFLKGTFDLMSQAPLQTKIKDLRNKLDIINLMIY